MTIAALVVRAPLRRGAKGSAVHALQLALIAHGHQLVADDDFWEITESAVKAFQASHGLRPDGEVGPVTAAELDKAPTAPAAEPQLSSALDVAPWLSVMRAITGTKEFPGNANNPIILSWVTKIVAKYPELRPGVGWYKSDATAWCGLGEAYCITTGGYRPPLNPLWALNWAQDWADGVRLKGPSLGAVAVLSRSGGGHVTMYEGENDTHWFGRGANQSDMVNVAKFPHARNVEAWMWPKGHPLPTTGRVRTSFSAAASAREA